MAESKKCPKCSKRFASNAAFQKHYAKAHYKPKKAAKKATVWKIPGFAKRRK